MKVLVTGASGRVGANLVVALRERGHEVRAHIFPGDKARMQKLDGYDVECVYGDFRDFEAFRPAARGVEAIYHLGAAMLGPFDNLSFFDTNAMGTRNVLEAALREAPNLHRFVYACTDAIYPQLPDGLTTEGMGAGRPRGMYAFSKWMGEQTVFHYHDSHRMPVVAFRFAYVIGAGEILNRDYFSRFWLSRWIASFEGRKDPEGQRMLAALRGLWPGEERLSLCRDASGLAYQMHLVDVRDLVQGLLLGMERAEAVGEAFTLAGPGPISWDEAIPYLSRRLDIPSVEVTLASVPHRAFDISKICDRLGYRPQHDLASMVDLALAMERGEAVDLIPTGKPYA